MERESQKPKCKECGAVEKPNSYIHLEWISPVRHVHSGYWICEDCLYEIEEDEALLRINLKIFNVGESEMNEDQRITFIQALEAMGACNVELIKRKKITSLEEAYNALPRMRRNNVDEWVTFMFKTPRVDRCGKAGCAICDKEQRYIGLRSYMSNSECEKVMEALYYGGTIQEIMDPIPIEAVRQWDEDLRSGKWWSKGRKGSVLWRKYLPKLGSR